MLNIRNPECLNGASNRGPVLICLAILKVTGLPNGGQVRALVQTEGPAVLAGGDQRVVTVIHRRLSHLEPA